MNEITTLLLELNLPVFGVVLFVLYSYLKNKFSPSLIAQPLPVQKSTFRRQSLAAQNVARYAA